mmetsp:Transcript_125948/g.367986  ORF Transcript_125948/g.367986 Transcript_125948/m.367986 type:complete len:454 (+) Transcript_125948:141-1502(+)
MPPKGPHLTEMHVEGSSGADLAARVGGDCLARFAVFAPLTSWLALVAVSRSTREAVGRAARGVPYRGAELDLRLDCHSATDALLRALLAAVAQLGVHSLRLSVEADLAPEDLPLPALQLPPSAEGLTLHGGAWRFFIPEVGFRSHNLLLLDITELESSRGNVLKACARLGTLTALRELRAGCPPAERLQVDNVVDQVFSVPDFAPRLEALDIGYSCSVGGLDIASCSALFHGCRSLRHLDFSMVMTWRDFDPVLELLTKMRLPLESLAIHGLQLSSTALADFCTVCRTSLANLQMRSCDLDPSALPPLLDLPSLRRVDFGGTILVIPQEEFMSFTLVRWLQQHGPKLTEVVLTGVILVHEEPEDGDEQLFRHVRSCEEWCRGCCPNAARCQVELTAVSTVHRRGSPVPVMRLKQEPHGNRWRQSPRFFERVHPTYGRALPRISVDSSEVSAQI